MTPDAAAAPGVPGLLDLRLIFVTGKGGTGKTTVAAALAQLAAAHGKRVLACEVDAKGDLASMFETGPTSFVEREVAPGVYAMSMDTEASLREYLKLHLRIPVVGRIGPLAKAFDFVATAAPGVKEILTVGKLCYEVREAHYDLVVVDAPATGHVIGQLAAPQAINDLVKVGLIRSQTDWMLEILSDPARTGLLAVTTPEEMPVAETLDLAARVANETTVRLSGVVVNRVLPELFSRREEEVFEQLRVPEVEQQLADAVERRRGRRVRGGPPGRHHAPDPVRAPRAPPAGPRPVRAGPPAALPVHPAARAAHHPPGGGVAGRGAGVLMAEEPRKGSLDGLLSAKEIVIACGPGGVGKTTTAAAAGRHGGLPSRRPGPGADHRPGQAAGRRPRPLGHRERRGPGGPVGLRRGRGDATG